MAPCFFLFVKVREEKVVRRMLRVRRVMRVRRMRYLVRLSRFLIRRLPLRLGL